MRTARCAEVLRRLTGGTLLALAFLSGSANAAEADTATPACNTIADDAARLKCYDAREGKGAPTPATAQKPASPRLGAAYGVVPPDTDTGPTLAEIWELDEAHKAGTFRLLPYRANYLLPARFSDNPNVSPRSPAPNHAVGSPLPIEATEVKFQLSFKLKAWENLLGDNGDVWLGYTQQSNWQLYSGNPGVSSAFRETNYEPEAFITLRSNLTLLGWHLSLLNLGFNHQSNGRSLPQSRSWNRVFAELGFERDKFFLQLRPWIRLPEDAETDDNPDIDRYLGTADARLTYVNAGFVYSLLGRYSVEGGRGAAQFDLAFPITGSFKGYVQLFSGYGESLIDYNHAQNSVGIGVLLVPWQ